MSISHISARSEVRRSEPAGAVYGAEMLGGYVRLQWSGAGGRRGGGVRGVVSSWSEQSRRRLFRSLIRTDFGLWPGDLSFCTLTYPGDWRSCAPDGRTVKGHLQVLRKRLDRRFGAWPAVWKLEFQRRGAPHFHLVLSGPHAQEYREYLRPSWAEVVGSGDGRHVLAGVQCDPVRSSAVVARYCAGYLGQRRKTLQELVPAGFNAGRWWGFWRFSPPVPERVTLARSEYHALRRLVRRLSGRRRCSWTVCNVSWKRVLECVR